MNRASHCHPAGNPFATRHIHPGAIAFRFPESTVGVNTTVQQLVARCENLRLCQVVGPHGSGKSTLLATLIPQLAARGHQIVALELHDGQRKLPMPRSNWQTWSDRTLIVVDGFEQLGWWRRARLVRFCRRRHAKLIVTTHRDMGLPTLWRTTTSLALFRALVHDLTAKSPEKRVTDQQIEKAYSIHGDNIREALFQLYDEVT